MDNLEEKVKDIIVEELGVERDKLTSEASFMEDLGSNPAHQARLKEIAEKAREQGKTTIAEFVQDAASMAILFSAGVDYVEGNFLAPAGPEMNYDFE